MVELLIEPVWSWPVVVVVATALLGVVLWTYPSKVQHLPPRWRKGLLALRLLTALVLIFAMFRPALRYSKTDKQPAQLIVLMDRSRSMTTPDGPGGRTRREALVRTLIENDKTLKAMEEEIEVRYFDFSETLELVDALEAESPGNSTPIGKTIDEIRRDDSGRKLVGIVLMSDGAQRASGTDNVDPRAAARRFAETRGIPIHTVTYGSSVLTGTGVDLAVEDVIVDTYPYEKQTVQVGFQLRGVGAAGRKVKVRLLREEVAGKGNMVEIPFGEGGGTQPFKEVTITGNQSVVDVELSFMATQAGERKIGVEVVPVNGEVQTRNNRYETLITVRKGGIKVAYFDVLREEQLFLRRLNDGQSKLQIDTKLLPSGSFLGQGRIDPSFFEPGAYDVYLIGDVPASVFRNGGTDLLAELARRCQEGAGLAMLGGAYNFGAGGYANTPIASLLPVQMSPAERRDFGAPPDPGSFIEQPVQFLPGPDGRSHYLTDLGVNSEAVWLSLPSLKDGANKLKPANDRVSLLGWSKEEFPLLLGWDTGRARVLALGVSDSWRWWTHGHEGTHRRFWEQLILWLARKEFESDQPVWVRVNPRNFTPETQVPIFIGVQDDRREPIRDAQVQVQVSGPDGTMTVVPVQQSEEGYLANFSQAKLPGDYQVEVSATRAGLPLGPSARTRFIVDPRDLELDNAAADPTLMAEIATMTGTAPVPPENFGAFLTALMKEGLKIEVTQHTQVNLWDGWPLLLTFVVLLTAEWFLRKRHGLV